MGKHARAICRARPRTPWLQSRNRHGPAGTVTKEGICVPEGVVENTPNQVVDTWQTRPAVPATDSTHTVPSAVVQRI